jgi:uncharacterized lipoprotein YddW (UPF0748 family)
MNFRKIFFLSLLLAAPLSGQTVFTTSDEAPASLLSWDAPQWAAAPHREVRAVWLTTLSGLDWPSHPARTAAEQQRQQDELCRILDRLQTVGINTVLFQTRLRGTTAYPSSYEPWDAAFSGKIGVAPPYDPLAFALAEAHRRGRGLQGGGGAVPLCTVAQERQLKQLSLPRRHPELCRRSGDRWMMDPGVPATADYLAQLCREIVERYDVDGIHLDYIRYPEKNLSWDDAATYRRYGGGQSLAAWRRENVDRVVQRIGAAVKAVRPWVKLSCSPVGKYADLPLQSSYGWNARDAVYQDARRWLQEGWMDLLFPMMYFDGKHFYPFANDWQEQSAGRPVVPGLGIYFLSPSEKDWPLGVVTRQLQFIRQRGMGGAAYFRSRFLTDDVKGLYTFLRDTYYARPSLPPAMTWYDSVAPTLPQLTVERQGRGWHLRWTAATDNAPATPVRYNLYRLAPGATSLAAADLLAANLRTTYYDYLPALPLPSGTSLVVTALDAYGNETPPTPEVNRWTVSPSSSSSPLPVAVSSLAVTYPRGVEAQRLRLADISGRCVGTYPPSDSLDVTSLPVGAYQVEAVDRRGRVTRLSSFRKNP